MNSFVSNLPIIAIITPFAVAFIIGLTGKKNINIKRALSFVATLISLIAVILLIKPIMIDKQIATYWRFRSGCLKLICRTYYCRHLLFVFHILYTIYGKR